jgi:hypothetical protein
MPNNSRSKKYSKDHKDKLNIDSKKLVAGSIAPLSLLSLFNVNASADQTDTLASQTTQSDSANLNQDTAVLDTNQAQAPVVDVNAEVTSILTTPTAILNQSKIDSTLTNLIDIDDNNQYVMWARNDNQEEHQNQITDADINAAFLAWTLLKENNYQNYRYGGSGEGDADEIF